MGSSGGHADGAAGHSLAQPGSWPAPGAQPQASSPDLGTLSLGVEC